MKLRFKYQSILSSNSASNNNNHNKYNNYHHLYVQKHIKMLNELRVK